MKRSRILPIILLALLIGGGWYFLQNDKAALLGRLLGSAQENGLRSFDGSKLQDNGTLSGNPLEEVAGLAIKGINLFQGNKGIELWRLKASWAHMSQNGEQIDVEMPVVRYALGDGSTSNPDDDVLDVKSKFGKITDNQRFLTLWDDVVITRYDDVLTGPRMTYNADKRQIVFPDGAELESPTASGSARVFSWDLAQNVMHASGDVLVILKPRTPTSDTSGKDNPAGTPASGKLPPAKPLPTQQQ